MRALSTVLRHYSGLGVLAVGLVVMMYQPAASAATDGPRDDQESAACMRTEAENRAECSEPLPPCPLDGAEAPDGPLVLLPIGVCGILVDSGAEKETRPAEGRPETK